MAHGQLAGRVHRHVAVPAQDRSILLAEQEAPLLLQRDHSTERDPVRTRIELGQPSRSEQRSNNPAYSSDRMFVMRARAEPGRCRRAAAAAAAPATRTAVPG